MESDFPGFNAKVLGAFDPSGRELGYYNGVGGYWWDQDVRAGGRMLAQEFTGVTYFLHANTLGSDTQVSNQAGTVLMDMLYYPWGEVWQTAGSTVDSHFAGFQQSAGPIFQTPNRSYLGSLGRWMTPDPAGMAAADPSKPQSWNRYAYVTNNPTTMTDPSGLDGDQPNHCKTEFVGAGPGEGVWKRVCDENDSVNVNGNASGGPTPSPSPNPGLQAGGNGQEAGGAAGGSATATAPLQAQAPQKRSQHCVSDFQKSTVGKVVGFGSLLSFFDNFKATALNWLEVVGTKGAYWKVVEWGGQSAAGPAEITPVVTEVTPVIGGAGTAGVVSATVTDLATRAGCSVVPLAGSSPTLWNLGANP